MKMYEGQRQAQDTIAQIRKLTDELKACRTRQAKDRRGCYQRALAKDESIAGAGGGGRAGGGGGVVVSDPQPARPLASVSGEMFSCWLYCRALTLRRNSGNRNC